MRASPASARRYWSDKFKPPGSGSAANKIGPRSESESTKLINNLEAVMADENENENEDTGVLYQMPKLRVQRVGKKFRIVYEETRNVAKFYSGETVDEGGFDDQVEAYKRLSAVAEGHPQADHEAETIGA